MDYGYYPEKKKKNGQHRPSYWIPVGILLLLVAISGVGFYMLNQFSVEPPQQLVFEVYADVFDGDNQPMTFNRLSITTRMPNGSGGGFESKGNIYEHHIHGYSYHETDLFEEGCIFGEVEIEGYEPHQFSYYVNNLGWGTRVTIRVVADESINAFATAYPQDIPMPVFMAKPSIVGPCPF